MGVLLKVSLKNGKIFNTSCSVAYIVLSYAFTLWYTLEFMIFDIKTSSAIIFLIIYTIFMILTLYFIKVSNSNIATLSISIFSILYLKYYSVGPLDAFLNSKFTNSLQHKSILTFGFLAQIIIIIFNLAILFFAILKLHELQESKKS